MILRDTFADATIDAALVDGMLHVADHPLPAEDADELVVVAATAGELEALTAGGYRWRRDP